jgi:hypothetical protein
METRAVGSVGGWANRENAFCDVEKPRVPGIDLDHELWSDLCQSPIEF